MKPCCTPTRASQAPAPILHAAPGATLSGSAQGMARLEGGEFWMGSEGPEAWPQDGEGPTRQVLVAPFLLDITAVTNAQWAAFVASTGYESEAERFGWSFVFHTLATSQAKKSTRGFSGEASWWLGIEGACWKRPEGPGSNVRGREEHPVVHVSWQDARSFCEWSGKRLPTEAEWEYAARGGLEQKLYPWGDELHPRGKNGRPEHRCNIWQGKFPSLDTGMDGFKNTAPAKHFAPNGFGLYQMSGNVWEWCEDWFSPLTARESARQGERENPRGPREGERKVIRGGSFLCHASYCNRYRCAARTSNTPDSTTSHTGFRCAR